MRHYENTGKEISAKAQSTIQQQSSAAPHSAGASIPMMENLTYQTVYPEIYYRVQPHVIAVCDQLNASGYMLPGQDVIQQMADHICEDLYAMYPDLESYSKMAFHDTPVQTAQFGFNFRRRGLLRDLTEILLLNELFRRL